MPPPSISENCLALWIASSNSGKPAARHSLMALSRARLSLRRMASSSLLIKVSEDLVPEK